MKDITSIIECNNSNCDNCTAYSEDSDLECFNIEKRNNHYDEQHKKETIKWLVESLKDKNEIKFWNDEYEIEIIPENVETIEIIEEQNYGHGAIIVFLARINDKAPIKIKCNAWRFPASRYEPEDYGMELEPIE